VLEPTSEDGYPKHINTPEEKLRYKRAIANLPSKDDLALVATVPTAGWTAQKNRLKQGS
jgi:hypothetical protein